MNFNNSVRNWQGQIIGFRCFECGQVKGQMWGNTCNECRAKQEEAEKLRHEIRKLTEQIRIQNEKAESVLNNLTR